MVPMVTNGKRRLPSDTIGRYHILPMVTDGRTPNAPNKSHVVQVLDVPCNPLEKVGYILDAITHDSYKIET